MLRHSRERETISPFSSWREGREMVGGGTESRGLSGFLHPASQLETQRGVKVPETEGLLDGQLWPIRESRKSHEPGGPSPITCVNR